METSAAPIFQTSTPTTSSASGASVWQRDTVSSSSSPSWTWRNATVCQASATMTLSPSMTGTVRQTPCWAAGVAGSNPPSSPRATSCWWSSARTEMRLTEGSWPLILVVKDSRCNENILSSLPENCHIFQPLSFSPRNPSGACKRELHPIRIHHFDTPAVLTSAGP